MTDVVEIARNRRSRLASEIAKLDDFIHMAELLLRSGDGPGKGREDDGGASRLLTPLFDLDIDRKGGSSHKTVPDADTKVERVTSAPSEARADVPKTATAAEIPSDESKGKRDDTDHFQFSARMPAEDEELVLRERDAADETAVDASIGQKLRQRRWMVGMTKKQLAERIGGEVEEVEKYERGEAQVGTGRMWNLAGALGVPMSYFFEKADDQSPGTGEARRQASSPAQPSALAKTA